MNKEKNEDSWVICPECKTKLKKENISAHLKHLYDKKIEDVDESSIKVLPKKGKKQKKTMTFSFKTIAIILVILVVIAALFFVLSGPSDEPNNNGGNGNPANSDWLDDYTPVHSLGTDDNAFWIDHPIDEEITHPQWVIDSLESNCVVFVVHRHTCTWCDPQAQRVIKLSEKYKNSVNFYDLDIDLGGDTETKGYEALIYDPDGAPHYIALTGIFTLIENDGKVEYAWHAWEGDMTEFEIEDWVKDAIYYYNINKEKIQ